MFVNRINTLRMLYVLPVVKIEQVLRGIADCRCCIGEGGQLHPMGLCKECCELCMSC